MREFSLLDYYKEKNQINLNSYKQKLESIIAKVTIINKKKRIY